MGDESIYVVVEGPAGERTIEVPPGRYPRIPDSPDFEKKVEGIAMERYWLETGTEASGVKR